MNAKRYFFLSLVLSLIFAGCLDYQQEVSLYPDGSGIMNIRYWMKIQDSSALSSVNQINFFNRDSLKQSFKSKFISIKDTVKDIKTFYDTTTKMYHVDIKLYFTHIDSLNKTRPFAESNFSLQDGAAGQKVFSQYIPPASSGLAIDASHFQVTFIYSFPGEIIAHNATKVDEKKKLYIWSYSLNELGKGKTISVTYRAFKLKETPNWIFWLSGTVFFIVIIFLFRKRKN